MAEALTECKKEQLRPSGDELVNYPLVRVWL